MCAEDGRAGKVQLLSSLESSISRVNPDSLYFSIRYEVHWWILVVH